MELLKVVIYVLVVLAEFVATTTPTPTKSLPSAQSLSHCPTTCGGVNISDSPLNSDAEIYPFGVGSGCFRQGFEFICKGTKLLLGDGTFEVPDFWGLNSVLFVNINIHIMAREANTYNGSWNPGPPFTMLVDDWDKSKFVVIGCGVDVYLMDGNYMEIGNCSTTCKSDEETTRQIVHCDGIGCCNIPVDHQHFPFHFKINRDKMKNKLALKNVKALLYSYTNTTYFPDHIFSKEDLDSEDTVQGSNFFPAYLAWSIADQPTCEKAKEDSATYACLSNHSECTNNSLAGTGYFCSCSQNYDGNPYIIDGCQDRNQYNRSQPVLNCPHQCGNVSVPFPFGLAEGCYGRESFRLQCKNSQLSLPQIFDWGDYRQENNEYQVTEVLVAEGLLKVNMPVLINFSIGSEDTSFSYTSTGLLATFSWVIDNITCKAAMQNRNNYACISSNSACLDINDTAGSPLGYRCICNSGYQGNPYISDSDGCEDINECTLPSPVCNGTCTNTPGNYNCSSCPSGTTFNPVKRECIETGRRSLLLGIVIGISSGISVLLFAICMTLLGRKWKKDEQRRTRKRHFNKNQGLLLEHLISTDESIAKKTKIFSLEELEIATNNFDRARILGQGGHGTVYKGILLDQRVVAIKRAKLVNSSEIKQFINEVVLLSQIIHRHVVKLFGCCLETEVPLLVYEFISNGTLYNKLHNNVHDKICFLSWGERLRIAAEAAGALAYLHSAASISIFHRDLKSTNILLDDNFAAKLSDFGASRIVPIDQKEVVTNVQGTFGYLDPEYYHTGQLSEKSDVYSFGVIIVELLTRKKPIFTNSLSEPVNLSNCFLQALKDGSYVFLLDDEILEQCTREEITAMTNLVETCLKMKGEERPTMKDVEMRLQFIRTSRKNQFQSTQTKEEKNQHDVAEMVCPFSHDIGSWGNQDSVNTASLGDSSWSQ